MGYRNVAHSALGDGFPHSDNPVSQKLAETTEFRHSNQRALGCLN
jgi:hypothetical protein